MMEHCERARWSMSELGKPWEPQPIELKIGHNIDLNERKTMICANTGDIEGSSQNSIKSIMRDFGVLTTGAITDWTKNSTQNSTW